jgi:hypothetical protein
MEIKDYICLGCNQKINSGFVAVLEEEPPIYLHFNDNKCIDQYKEHSKRNVLIPRILPFSDLEQRTNKP